MVCEIGRELRKQFESLIEEYGQGESNLLR